MLSNRNQTHCKERWGCQVSWISKYKSHLCLRVSSTWIAYRSQEKWSRLVWGRCYQRCESLVSHRLLHIGGRVFNLMTFVSVGGLRFCLWWIGVRCYCFRVDLARSCLFVLVWGSWLSYSLIILLIWLSWFLLELLQAFVWFLVYHGSGHS